MKPLLPWVDILLDNVKKEYATPSPKWKRVAPVDTDFAYVKSILDSPSGFSSDYFIKEVITSGFPLKKFVSNNIEFLIFSESMNAIPLTVWFHIARLLGKKNHVRVVYFGNLQKRVHPKQKKPIEPIHINGGYTNSCNFSTIVIYREEDSTRVLIHELLHASCSDPRTSVPFVEADTEAWAEVIYCAIKAKGVKKEWESCMEKQLKYASEQTQYATNVHNVKTPNDYAWRYINGRLKVWEAIGFKIPYALQKKHSSLRLTYTDI
jgi:hypothetical protein